MPRRLLVLSLAISGGTALAQSPPPRPLPASITGRPAMPPAVTPAGASQVVAAPIDRFLGKPGTYPPETEQAAMSVRLGTDWLARMNEPGGRFVPGLNPAARQWVAGDSDFRQALAGLALADGARFTGDERAAARASGAVLALLTRTKPDAANPSCRVPTGTADALGFAAATALAVYHLPTPDAGLVKDADALVAFVRRQVSPDGSFTLTPSDLACGLALQAMSASLRAKPDAAAQASFAKALAFQAKRLHSEPTPMLLAATLPALVDAALVANKDAAAVAQAFDAADRLCAAQLALVAPQHAAWYGGFPAVAGAEPTADSALCAMALCHAARLTRQVPDAARFTKYRAAAVEGLAFGRRLQFTDDSAEHFEKAFRARYVAGGVRVAPADGTLRIDAAAAVVLGHVAFLECGTERPLQ